MTPIKAIRAFCIECCCGDKTEVKKCPCFHCPLWDFRLGHNPNIKRQPMNEEQKKLVAERLKKARNAKEDV